MRYVAFDSFGAEVLRGEAPEDSIDPLRAFHTVVLVDAFPPEAVMLAEGEIVAIPPTPTPYHVWDWETKTWSLPEAAMSDATEEARIAIDAAAGAARARYLTVSPGQDATYSAKYADAIAYLAAGSPEDASDFPWVESEAASTGLPLESTAQRIKTTGDFWGRVKGPQIEAARISGKDAIMSLETIEAIDAHRAAVIAQLGAM